MASNFNPLTLLQQSGHPIFSVQAQQLVSNPGFNATYQQQYQNFVGAGKTPQQAAEMAAQMAASVVSQQQEVKAYQGALGQGLNQQQAQITAAAPNALDFSSKTGALPGTAGNTGTLAPLSQSWLDTMVAQMGSNPQQSSGGPSAYYRGDVSKLQQYPTGTPSSPITPPFSYDRYGRLVQPGQTSATPGQSISGQPGQAPGASPGGAAAGGGGAPQAYTPPGSTYSPGNNYNTYQSNPNISEVSGNGPGAYYTPDFQGGQLNEPPSGPPGYTGYAPGAGSATPGSPATPPGSELAQGNAGQSPWIPRYPNTPSSPPSGYQYPYSPADYGAVSQGGRPNTYSPPPGNTDIYPFSGQTGYQDPNYFYQVNAPPQLPMSPYSQGWNDNWSNTGYLGDDPSLNARSDRALALSQGTNLADTFNILRNQAYGSQRAYEQAGARAYAPIAAGQGGYTQEERAGILRPDELYGLYQSPEEQARSYLTPAEQQQIYADPSSAYQAYDWTANSIGQGLTDSAGNQRGAFAGSAPGVYGYGNYQYLDPKNLTMSDQDVQDIVNKSANTVRTGTQADIDRIYASARQAGTNQPGALATALTRRAYTGDVNAADAMTNARIAGRQAQIGAGQAYSQLGTGVGQTEQARALALEQGIGAQDVAARQYLGSQLQGAAQYADTNASTRAANLAANRQGAEQYNQGQRYTRGTNIYNTASGANTQFADARLKAEQEYRNWLNQQQSQASQNVNVAGQQQIGTYGALTGATQGATSNLIKSEQGPSTWQSILGMKRGGVTEGPTPALVGESGPELILRLDKLGAHGYRPDDEETGPIAYRGRSFEMPKMGGGGLIGAASSLYGAYQNRPQDPQRPDYANMDLPPEAMYEDPNYDPKMDPIYQQEVLATVGRTPQSVNRQQPAPQQQQGPGLIGAAGKLLPMLFLADGGVFGVNGTSKEHVIPMADGGYWISSAIKHPGALTESAHHAGMTPHAYAEDHRHDSGTTGQRARLALTLSRMRHAGSGMVAAPATRPVEYVNHPQVRMLGSRGPTAVVPLRPGPHARVTMADVPGLVRAYGR